MTDQTYNGWTNYETWNVKLWIDNDQCTQAHWLERAKDVASIEDANFAPFSLANELENMFDEGSPLQENASCYSDLLRAALGRVEWIEIARSLIEDAQELGA
jgi:hypothetical protein